MVIKIGSDLLYPSLTLQTKKCFLLTRVLKKTKLKGLSRPTNKAVKNLAKLERSVFNYSINDNHDNVGVKLR